MDAIVCFRCGKPLAEDLLPLAREQTCPNCHAYLHSCRMCTWFDLASANQCREPVADPVKDKDRANFCGYFTLGPPKAADQQREKALLAKNELAALFGEESAERSEPSTASPAKTTRAALDALFGLDGPNPEK